MLYANVVLGLPVEGPFDYLVPVDLEDKISVGARARVNFRNKKETAYVVGLSRKTRIKKLKEVSALIDREPVLDKNMLLLAKRLAEYYCCSWGEAIETAIPDELRKGKEIKINRILPVCREPQTASGGAGLPIRPVFLQGQNRMPFYLKEIKEASFARKSAIILFSGLIEAEKAKEEIQKSLGLRVFVSFRKQPHELDIWEKIREADCCVVLGCRSSIFSPVNNLGLIIIDQEQDQVYKQEQSPHYHARQAALMRAEIENAKIIFSGSTLSLESFYLAQKEGLELQTAFCMNPYPEIKVIDARRLAYAERKNKSLFSKFLTDQLSGCLSVKGKSLLVINRKGFATGGICHNCKALLKCPRCNINLVLHFEEDKLECHHCNFKMNVPEVCPSCNAGYIKYSGIGTEKVESELARIFPQARIKIIKDAKKAVNLSEADIFVATSLVIKQQGVLSFDLVGVLAIDNSLNRVDFRASEKVFSLLTGLAGLAEKKMIIQSANASHHCFRALVNNDPQLFYNAELKARRQLELAPFKHMILLKLRGAVQEKVKQASAGLFEKLNSLKSGSIKVLSLNLGHPEKLRGNFYYQILMRASSVQKACSFLKLHLKEWHYSGIMVSVDVDPV